MFKCRIWLKHAVHRLVLLCVIGSVPIVTSIAEIIPPDRRISWVPGLQGGIPHYPVAINATDPPYSASGNGTSDDTQAIQAAIDACPPGQAVYLPAGTYRITSTLTVRSSIALRGAGPDETQIVVDPATAGEGIRIGTWSQFGSPVSLTSTAAKSATTINVAGSIGYDFVVLSQENVPGLVTPQGYGSTCGWCGGDDPTRTMTQVAPVVSSNGSQLVLGRPTYFEYRADLNATAMGIGMLKHAGVEDLSIEQAAYSGNNHNIRLYSAAYCWVSNVRSEMTNGAHVALENSYGCEVRDSVMNDAHSHESGRGYGVFVYGRNSDHLIENNIIRRARHSMVFEGGGSGSVFGYNYCVEVYAEPAPDFLSEDANTHGAHPFMNLFEGNVFAKLSHDNTWGSSSHNTSLRNRVSVYAEQAVYGLVGIDIQANNYYINVVGNVIGNTTRSYTPWRIGYTTPGGGSIDPQVANTLLRHGNRDIASGSTQWDSGIADHQIPASYYLGSRPEWFGSLPWPAFGPDVPFSELAIPAARRFATIDIAQPPAPSGLRVEPE